MKNKLNSIKSNLRITIAMLMASTVSGSSASGDSVPRAVDKGPQGACVAEVLHGNAEMGEHRQDSAGIEGIEGGMTREALVDPVKQALGFPGVHVIGSDGSFTTLSKRPSRHKLQVIQAVLSFMDGQRLRELPNALFVRNGTEVREYKLPEDLFKITPRETVSLVFVCPEQWQPLWDIVKRCESPELHENWFYLSGPKDVSGISELVAACKEVYGIGKDPTNPQAFEFYRNLSMALVMITETDLLCQSKGFIEHENFETVDPDELGLKNEKDGIVFYKDYDPDYGILAKIDPDGRIDISRGLSKRRVKSVKDFGSEVSALDDQSDFSLSNKA